MDKLRVTDVSFGIVGLVVNEGLCGTGAIDSVVVDVGEEIVSLSALFGACADGPCALGDFLVEYELLLGFQMLAEVNFYA